jgi:hypothetical protein
MRDTIARALAGALAVVMPVALGLAGCGGRRESPDCRAVGAAYATLLQRELDKPTSAAPAAGAPEAAAEDREKALSLIPLTKETIVTECTDKNWAGEVRRCVVAAKTVDDLERCHVRKPPEPAAAPAAAGSSDSK